MNSKEDIKRFLTEPKEVRGFKAPSGEGSKQNQYWDSTEFEVFAEDRVYKLYCTRKSDGTKASVVLMLNEDEIFMANIHEPHINHKRKRTVGRAHVHIQCENFPPRRDGRLPFSLTTDRIKDDIKTFFPSVLKVLNIKDSSKGTDLFTLE
ncbi:MAG: hypothetical protein K9N22_10470 [Candidatus Marinimicrobia bacterium]|nr:hypothetical protein [Candidatus Neomarinimicrobiota bacterium]MCF7902158.1 hypothetical protein [Candidatus Neomarinimicrobiota bacterium]